MGRLLWSADKRDQHLASIKQQEIFDQKLDHWASFAIEKENRQEAAIKIKKEKDCF